MGVLQLQRYSSGWCQGAPDRTRYICNMDEPAVTEREAEKPKEPLKPSKSIRSARNFEALKHNAELPSKFGKTFGLEQTEAKMTMHNELASKFYDSSLQRMSKSQDMEKAESGSAEAPPRLGGISEQKSRLDVLFGEAGMKKTSSSPELNSPEEAGLNSEEESEQRANSICNGEANASVRVKQIANLRISDPPGSTMNFRESLNRKLNQGGTDGTRLSARGSCKVKWTVAAACSLDLQQQQQQQQLHQMEPRLRSGSIKDTFDDLSQALREEENFNPLKFTEKIKDVRNTKRADMTGLKDKFELQNQWTESRRQEQKRQVGDFKDYFEERAKVEAKYAKDLERLAKHFSEKSQKEALGTSGDLYLGIVNEASKASVQHTCLSQVFQVELGGKRCEEIVKDIDRVFVQARRIGMDVQVELMQGMTDLHTFTMTLTNKAEELKHATIRKEQADVEKKKLEDRGRVEKDKKKYARLVEDCKQKTERQKIALSEVVKAQKELILANSEVNAMTKQYFEEDMPILVNCADLGFHQNLKRLANARVDSMEQMINAQQRASKSIIRHASRLDSKMDKERFFDGCLTSELTDAPEPFTLPPIDKKKLPSPQEQEDLKNELRAGIEVKINKCKKLTKELDLRENLLLDLMEFKDWDLTKQFAVARSKATNRVSTSSQDANDAAGEVSTNSQRKALMEKDYLSRTKELMMMHGKLKQSEAKYSAIRDLMAGKNPELDPVLSVQMRKMKTQTCGRPRVFGGDLDDLFEATGQMIPPVVASCVDTIRRLGMNHQGIFRIGGAHNDIDGFEKSFLNEEDPFAILVDDTHLNSVASILKRFFHRLPEPIFPKEYFDQLMMIARAHPATATNSIRDKMEKGDRFKEGFVVAMKEVVDNWSTPKRTVVSHLFSLLADLSQKSSVTQMDPYNIAICFAPNLCPIPDGYDQMQFTNQVNILVKNFIIFSAEIFGISEVPASPQSPCPTINLTKKRPSSGLPDLVP